MGFRTGGCSEAAVFPCKQKMSDSEDSNFSEEEDSERSSDGEEAEVCGRDAGGDTGLGDRTRVENGSCGSLERIRTSSGLWELTGCPEGERERNRQAQVKQKHGCWRPWIFQIQ